MHDCEYCSESFEDEEPYLVHLQDDHPDDLGPIEQRRVDGLSDGSDGVSRFVLAAAVVVGFVLVGGVAIGVLGGDGGGANAGLNDGSPQQPTGLRTTHFHGGMTVTIDGQTLDFSRDEYQLQDDFFHYEASDGSQWHVHGTGVTLEYALETFGIEVAPDALAFEGATYYAENATVQYLVDGQPVNPRTYELRPNDRVTVVASAENESA